MFNFSKMRIRKCLALGGAILIFLGCLIIYRMADYTLYLQEGPSYQSQSVHMSPDKKNLNSFADNSKANEELNYKFTSGNPKSEISCTRFLNNNNADLQVLELYKEIKFDNIDGGAWKQGWNIETNPEKWNSKNKLKVFIVPHSHNDPGWLKTFEDYYKTETREILNNMLKKLTTDTEKKFIWAEISFFSRWWDELSEEDQEKVKTLIQRGQLEMVTGGWVMNDEANTHYYSMILQLTEGHQWMKSNIETQPQNGWTIDPFGESPVMAYFLKKMGVENLVIQRVHYSLKKYLARMKNLEFKWRQSWDFSGDYDLLTHMTPFYSYDIPHTCGPDPKICCQFDFKRLPGNGLSCPWMESPKPITKKNVAVRAQMLLDQYRKKSELYRTNVLLVPLGDDFRYQHLSEWDYQFENYYRIFKYINSNPQLHAEMKFATLNEYFEALRKEPSSSSFLSLTGDFFTYADRDDHYWSGYYTSRPFYKRMDRILMGFHRAAEIIFSLGWGNKNLNNSNWLLMPQTGFAKMLRDARRSLSLFQHHDGITGTARDNVMEDYAQKMINAINYSKHIIQQVTHFLLSSSSATYDFKPEKNYFEFDEERKYFNEWPKKKVFSPMNDGTITVVLFNSLSYKKKELISLLISSPLVEIYDSEGNVVMCQTSPVFSQDEVMDDQKFEVSFVAHLPALGLTSYKILFKSSNEILEKNVFSNIRVFNQLSSIKPNTYFQNIEKQWAKEFSVENQKMTVTINEKGLLKSIRNKETMEFIPLHLDFVRYLAREGKERSGAYLFLPDGEATVISEESPLIRVYEGPLFTRIEVKLTNVDHFLNIYNTPELSNLGIEVVNFVDILTESNFELAMRLTSHVKSNSNFFSDLNGFQMVKRTRFSKLPIQANFYPMPTASYIEDHKSRITIVSGQPLGVASLREGELEVIQDRRLKQDDNRGLGQGVMDNKVTSNTFRILVERRLENCDEPLSSLSATAYEASQYLLNPAIKMVARGLMPELSRSYSPVNVNLKIDLHLLSVRTFDEEEIKPSAGFVFHRPYLHTCFLGSSALSNGNINLHSFLPNHFGNNVRKYSLSFLKEEEVLDKKENLKLCYMDFLSLLLS